MSDGGLPGMRVMSYNILNGGRDGDDNHRWQTEVEVITDVDPDVLLVQEARGFDAEGCRQLFEAEQALGMRGLLAVAPHTGQHTAVFLAPPLRPLRFDVDSVHFHHALAQASVEVPGFAEPVTLASIHLSPLSPALRLTEVGWLAALAAPDRLAVIAGDANSLAPGDPAPQDWAALPAHFRVRYLADPVDGQPRAADRSALRFLHDAGFRDAAAQYGDPGTPTVPTAGYPTAEFIPFRSDHVLLSPRLAPHLTRYQVLDDPRTATASDHLPVLIELAAAPAEAADTRANTAPPP